MVVLAEISDKMWSVPGMFFFALLFALPTSALGLVRWWLALPALVLAGYGNHALWMEMHAPGMWGAILNELGWSWVIGNFVAWNMAFVVCWIGLMMINKQRTRSGRISEGLCVECGYNLTGNVSGICPECGERI